jgi:hypothetical protein
MLARLRQPRLFRTALLVLLALGVVVKPTLAALGELHDAEHAVQASSHGHDHGHTHGHEGDPSPDPRLPPAGDPDHAQGTHGLLHVLSTVSLALPDAVVRLAPAPTAALPLPDIEAPRLPGDAPSLPFRPPIA